MQQETTRTPSFYFITRYYGKARGGVGKYEQSIFPHLAQIAGSELVPIQAQPVPEWLAKLARFCGRDLRALLANHPSHIAKPNGEGLVHISNELLALALLFYRGPSVVTVHHLPPLWSADFRKETGREWWFYLLAFWGLRRATRIIVDSQWTGSQVQQALKIGTGRIDVVPLAVDHEQFRPQPVDLRLRDKYGLGQGPYILYVGGFETRKNLLVLVRAFETVRHHFPGAQLLLVGPAERTINKPLQEALDEVDGHKLLGYVPLQDLVALYNLATVFVMPSLLEGFCLPVLEAMSCGCPVVAAKATAVPELVADAGILFDPQNVEELAAALVKVLSDNHLQATMSRCGLERAQQYHWKQSAERTIEIYRHTLEKYRNGIS